MFKCTMCESTNIVVGYLNRYLCRDCISRAVAELAQLNRLERDLLDKKLELRKIINKQ